MQFITAAPLRVTRLLTKEANTVPFPSLWRSAGKKEAGLGSTIFNRVAKPLAAWGKRKLGQGWTALRNPDVAGVHWNSSAMRKMKDIGQKYAPLTGSKTVDPPRGAFEELVDSFIPDLRKRGYRSVYKDVGAKLNNNRDYASLGPLFTRGSQNNNIAVGFTSQSPGVLAHEMIGHPGVFTEQWGRYVPKPIKSFWNKQISPRIPERIKSLNPWRDPTEASPILDRTRSTNNWFNNRKWLNNERVKSFLAPAPIRQGLGKKILFATKGENAPLAEAQQYIQAPWSNRQWLNNISGRVFNAPVQAGLNAASTALTGIPLGSIPSMALNVAANGPQLYHELNASARGLIGLARKKGLNYAWKQSPQLRHAFHTYFSRAVPGLIRNATGMTAGYGGYQGYQALNNAYRSPQQSR